VGGHPTLGKASVSITDFRAAFILAALQNSQRGPSGECRYVFAITPRLLMTVHFAQPMPTLVAGDPDPRLTRSLHIHEQLELLGGRDLQLWSIGLLIIVVLAAGFSALILPNMVWKASIGSLHVQEKYLPQLFYGLISLILLFNAYIILQKRSLNATRTALIHELTFNERLETLSLIDPATQLFSRPALDQFALHEISRANRTGNSLTFLMIELRLPREGNGKPEQSAERLIGEAAQLMKGTFRGGDILIRYSRDRFLVLMPDTNRRQAERATVRLRERADQWNLGNAQLEMVLNCGAAEYRTGASLDSMLLRAEQRIAACSPDGNEFSQQRPSSSPSLEEHSTARQER